MNRNRITGILVVMLLAFGCAFSQTSDWELAKNKDGIVVHTRSLNGSKFKQFKATATLDASLTTVVALILDTKNVDKWYHQAANPKIISDNKTEGYYRMDFDLPWPVDTRDEVVHWVVTQDAATKVVRVDLTGVPKYAPEQDGIVRMPKLESFWKLTPLENGKTEVFHQAHVEPGGSVPAWLANATVTDGPYNSISGMKSRLSLYKDTKLDFIKE